MCSHPCQHIYRIVELFEREHGEGELGKSRVDAVEIGILHAKSISADTFCGCALEVDIARRHCCVVCRPHQAFGYRGHHF